MSDKLAAQGMSKEEFSPLCRSDGRYYDVNFFEYWPENIRSDSLPTSYIFDRALSFLSLGDQARKIASSIRAINGVNKTLWGIRKEGSGYSLEYYFYYPKKYPQNKLSNVLSIISDCGDGLDVPAIEHEDEYYLSSVNLSEGRVTDANLYESIFSSSSELFFFEDKGLTIDRFNPEFVSYSLTPRGIRKANSYYAYFDANDLPRILRRVYSLASEKFPGEDPFIAYDFLKHIYAYYSEGIFRNCIIAAKDRAVGLYFLGLDVSQFIIFLRSYSYDSAFVAALEVDRERFSHIKFDVGMDFIVSGGEFHIKKTAFWGSF